MCWLLTGCCVLALISLSGALKPALQVTQRPRFYGIKPKSKVIMCCYVNQRLPALVDWYKADAYDEDVKDRKEIQVEGNRTKNPVLIIPNVQLQDSGVYFCKWNDTWGPGTQLVVVKHIDHSTAQYRTNVKDVLIIFQGLLLAVCIAALLLHNQTLWEKDNSQYEEPEIDHIYAGLEIETCGGGLYEELSVYAQPEGAEAPWE